jgi:hypothetical protein
MISICARVVSPVEAWVSIIVLTRVVFHGLSGRQQNTKPSFVRG